ncbi:hypothetical protein XENOCAPTIV_004735 [Xenoophorus captivus]|uniref:Uncharacterized protein n=1 Tax=Xenoophorus captivus TaxID=1517983 RepID=A0ABV0RQM1_9TELE
MFKRGIEHFIKALYEKPGVLVAIICTDRCFTRSRRVSWVVFAIGDWSTYCLPLLPFHLCSSVCIYELIPYRRCGYEDVVGMCLSNHQSLCLQVVLLLGDLPFFTIQARVHLTFNPIATSNRSQITCHDFCDTHSKNSNMQKSTHSAQPPLHS